jgi:hypothetical protein
MKLLKPFPAVRMLNTAAALALLLLAAACMPGGSQATPTANPTLVAVEQMLTQTSAAPTATPTPTITLTPTFALMTETPAPGSLEIPADASESISVGPLEIHVLSLQKLGANADRKPAEGLVFVDIEVRVRHSGAGGGVNPTGLYTPSHFALVHGDRREFTPIKQPVEPQLRSGSLRENEFVRGHITFEAPDSEVYSLRYSVPGAEAWIDLRSAPGSASTAGDGPALSVEGLLPAGHKAEAAGAMIEINQVQVFDRLPEVKPASGYVYVQFLASIFNTDRDTMPYNPGYFLLKDLNGYEYAPANVLPDDSLNAGTLKKNQRVDGRVLFEVPADAVQPGRQFVVSYLPLVLFEEVPYEEIRVVITPRK